MPLFGTFGSSSIRAKRGRRGGGGLYDFTTGTFTPGGATGRLGPSLTQARNGLTGSGTGTWKNNTEFFNTSSGIQLWTVPQDGTYRIEAWGAQGTGFGGLNGGFGARMRGDFTLTAGEIIRILVGQQSNPTSGRVNLSSPGGGGSFVVRDPYSTNQSILVIAGGGGGTGNERPSTSNATTSTSGQTGSHGSGGTNGNGGTSGNSGAGSGGGFFGNGQASGSSGGNAFVNGGLGGVENSTYSVEGGGFGAGGSITSGGNSRYGGGGGYSGGSGSSSLSGATTGLWGGGGGSFNSGSNQSNTAGARSGNGQVTITLL
jgi:hypothetical protein